ncbi:MAG: redoxin family protein, partial [Candidatus Marinimicrobia bacterium]|nr:redoxin family protein [Candidatus Neomarinimicrobiota bacterium]MBT5267879.1 redoxin family protein [Candidatus Neomarinimicrobiota bacterium]
FLLIAFTRLSTSDFGLIIGSFFGLLAAQSISYLFRSNEPNWSDSTQPDTKVLCISRDTPFAQSRFCGAEGLENVITLSDFESGQFGKDYGLQVVDSVMKGFLSRVVIIVDVDGKVVYTQQVPVISDEPNYDEVVAKLG